MPCVASYMSHIYTYMIADIYYYFIIYVIVRSYYTRRSRRDDTVYDYLMMSSLERELTLADCKGERSRVWQQVAALHLPMVHCSSRPISPQVYMKLHLKLYMVWYVTLIYCDVTIIKKSC